jgi:glutathione peroxidase-family protein
MYIFLSTSPTARPEECPAIKRFVKKKGVDFTMMDKVDVNGVEAHPVYHYLKKVAGPVRIDARYYIFSISNMVSFNWLTI